MGKVKRLLQILICGSLIFSLSGCDMIQKTPEAKKKTVVAKVQNDEITLKDVDAQLGSYISQIKQQYKVDDISKSAEGLKALQQYRENVLDSLVHQEMFIKKAKELKVIPSEADLKKEIDEQLKTIKSAYSKEDDFKAALKKENMTESQLNEEIKKMVISRKVSDYIIKDVKVTEKEQKDYYNSHKKSNYTKAAGANMYHILVPTEDKAKEIKTKLNGGAKFEDLAKEYGTDGTKTTGGSLGYVEYTTTNMDQDFLKAAKALKDGQISDPVKTQFGYHIIMVKNVHKDNYVQPFDEVKKDIESNLLKTKQQDTVNKKIEEWKKEYNVKENKDKLTLTY